MVRLRGGMAEERLLSERVIRNSNGQTPRRQAALTAVYRLADRAGVPRKSIHAGRHTGTTFMISKLGIAAGMAQARHSSLKTTQGYEHLVADESLRGAENLRFTEVRKKKGKKS